MATTGPIKVEASIHPLVFEACKEGNKLYECVLADGHDHRTGGDGTPGWEHITRNGNHWNAENL